jgi:hypothetical protein
MPWKDTNIMDQRVQFIGDWLERDRQLHGRVEMDDAYLGAILFRYVAQV